jgi:tetratricopeptide (TPR) repeat protein
MTVLKRQLDYWVWIMKMSNKHDVDRMNHEIGIFYFFRKEFDLSIEYFKKAINYPGSRRYLGLAYSERDDLENAKESFINAVDSQDYKALPWLVRLLTEFDPSEDRLIEFVEQHNELLKKNDVDIVFSEGTYLQFLGDTEGALKIWHEHCSDANWAIFANSISIIIQDSEVFMNNLPKFFKECVDKNEVVNLIIETLEKQIENGSVEALNILLEILAIAEDDEIVKSFEVEYFYNNYLKCLSNGVASASWHGLKFLKHYADKDFDETDFWDIIKTNDLQHLIDYDDSSIIKSTQKNYLSKDTSSAVKMNQINLNALDDIFQEAEEARNNQDSLGEIRAWIKGINLGNSDCLHNLAITLCNEIGIQYNFFGASGGDDNPWSALATGILSDENKPWKNLPDVNFNTLNASFIQGLRERYELNLEIKESFNAFHTPIDIRNLKDIFQSESYTFIQLSDNLFAFPYSTPFSPITIFAELVEINQKNLLLIYTTVLTSVFDLEGAERENFIDLNPVQKKTIEILIRSKEMIFPNSSFDLGTIFNSVPKDLIPKSFINYSFGHENWLPFGKTEKSVSLECLPTKYKFQRIEVGYKLDLGLQSLHLEKSVKDIFSVIISVVEQLESMRNESSDLFKEIFNHDLPSDFEMETSLKDFHFMESKGSQIITLLNALNLQGELEKESKLFSLADGGFSFSIRVLGEEIQMTENNIDRIAELVLKESNKVGFDFQLRNILNNLGWFYRKISKLEKANSFFEVAAKMGSGNAMSNLSWQCLESGDSELARKVFDESFYTIMTTRNDENYDFEQAANCASNDAIHRLLLGHPVEEVKRIWNNKWLQGDHLESRFYPILIDFMEGAETTSLIKLNDFSSSDITELREIFDELVNYNTRISDIASKALTLLQKIKV